MSARRYPSPCRFHPADLCLTSKPIPLSNQLNGVNELSTLTLSRSLSTATGLPNWRWKKLNPRVIPEHGLWNISSIVVGDVRDRHGFQVDGWHQAAQLANYRRRHFGVPEDPHPYHDFDTREQTETTDAASALPNLSQPPVPITQLAWLLHSILCPDPAGNDSIYRLWAWHHRRRRLYHLWVLIFWNMMASPILPVTWRSWRMC